jgi:hypothetical protein
MVRVNRTNWVNFKTQDMGFYYRTQWNDLCFISKRNFFESLNYKIDEIPLSRWDRNPNLSSWCWTTNKFKDLNERGYRRITLKNLLLFMVVMNQK